MGRYTLEEAELIQKTLVEKGYVRYENESGRWKNCNFIYWKSFDKQKDEFGEKIIGYQVGFAFYDYSDYPGFIDRLKSGDPKCVSIAYEMLLGDDKLKLSRVDLTITDSQITLEEFEDFCSELYSSDFLKKYKKSN